MEFDDDLTSFAEIVEIIFNILVKSTPNYSTGITIFILKKRLLLQLNSIYSIIF